MIIDEPQNVDNTPKAKEAITSSGTPIWSTREEMGLIPYQSLYDDDECEEDE